MERDVWGMGNKKELKMHKLCEMADTLLTVITVSLARDLNKIARSSKTRLLLTSK